MADSRTSRGFIRSILVHRLANGTFLRRGDHHQPGSDANAHLQPAGVRRISLPKGLDDLQPGADRALGLTLVRQRVAEEGDDAIT
jgi:hypothetical protein